MLQRTVGSGLALYLAGKAAFDRRRRKSTLDFDALYDLFASGLAVAKDRVLTALMRSAERAGRNRTIEPIVCRRGHNPVTRFRHRAVRVDGRQVEPVHHIRRKRVWPSGEIVYAVTSVSRKELESAAWAIFYVDVPSFRRRVIRCRSARLLRALFPSGTARKNVYIPLNGRPEAPRYNFLADEDNWG
jgi:hypothetical protein